MNKLLLTFTFLISILVVLYFNGVLSFYTQAFSSINFNGANAFIGFDSNGNLRSIPVNSVSSGIDRAVKGTTDSLVSNEITDLSNKVSRNKASAASNKASAASNTSGIASLNTSKANKSVLSSYVKRGSPVSIQVGAGNTGYEYSSSNPRYLDGSWDNWRIAYDKRTPDAKFILN